MENHAVPGSGGSPIKSLEKAPTGIRGFDAITMGGLPRGRPTLVSGGPGCGKTLFATEFLVHGALDFGEPGVLLTFEESEKELATNVASLGYDLEKLKADRLLVLDAFRLDPAEFVETGAYDLEGLFVRLAFAVESVGARRVVLDTVEVLFSALANEHIVRSELARLLRWLKDRELTAVITGEQGDGTFSRHGIEEYVSDCVILLDHRVENQASTRRIRVVKYRGSLHGGDEYPFLIGRSGVDVMPITSVGLDYEVPRDRISTGVERLDHMLGGGIFCGSTVLVSGDAGTGKTTLLARSLEAACERGERSLFVSFEESPDQIQRDLASVGIDVGRWSDAGLLRIASWRPSAFGIEAHLVMLVGLIDDFQPENVAIDGMSSLEHGGSAAQVTSLVTRTIDLLKSRGLTAYFSALTANRDEASVLGVSSLIDTWLLLRNVEANGERNRILFIIKARGTAHSNQVREFVLSDDGIDLLDVPLGSEGAALGSARLALATELREASSRRLVEAGRRHRQLERHAAQLRAQIAALEAELEAEADEDLALNAEESLRSEALAGNEATMGSHRWQDGTGAHSDGSHGR